MKALLLLSLLVLSAAADVADVAEVADVADPEVVADVVPELQEEKQLLEDEVPFPEEEEAAMFAAAALDAPDTDRMFVCPSGWVRYKNSCYLYVSSALSWSGAEANCARQGASLASFHDVFEYSFLQSLTGRAGGSTAWTGGFYFQTWRWLDQSRFTYFGYSSLNSVGTHQCVRLWFHTGWTNNICTTSRPFICMKRTDTC